MSTDYGKGIVKQYERLRTQRTPLDTNYRDCYLYTYPSLGAGFNQTGTDGFANAATAAGDQSRLFDSTGTDAVRLLASSVLSSLTPPGTRWFNLFPAGVNEEDIDQAGMEWLNDAAEIIHTKIHASNYDTESLELMIHMMVVGMSGLYITLKGKNLHFENWTLNHLYCQDTLGEGYIDTVYKEVYYTAQQSIIEFGLSKLPRTIQEAYKRDEYDTKLWRFVLTIRPRIKGGKQSQGKLARNLPWESCWVADDGTVVRESGFDEMPSIVPRWLKIPDTDYARGPVYDALPDLKTLNKVKENMLQSMDMHISGMFKVKDDGVVNPATIRFGPRRMIAVGDMDNLQPLQSGGDVQFAVAEIQSLQSSVRKMLLADQLGPVEKAIQTATEIQTRNNQVRQVLGPIFSRLQSEFLKHLITRCFGLLERNKLLPQIPDSLKQFIKSDGSIEIEYRSPLARSQKMMELQAIDEYTNRMNALAQTNPAILDYINFDRIATKYGELLGTDPELINEDDTVKKIRQDRAKQKQAEQAQLQAAEQAKLPTAQLNGPSPLA